MTGFNMEGKSGLNGLSEIWWRSFCLLARMSLYRGLLEGVWDWWSLLDLVYGAKDIMKDVYRKT